MKDKSVPVPVIVIAVVIVVAVIGVLSYTMFLKPEPKIDIKTISPTRLEDPNGGHR